MNNVERFALIKKEQGFGIDEVTAMLLRMSFDDIEAFLVMYDRTIANKKQILSVFMSLARLVDLNDGAEVNLGAMVVMHQEFDNDPVSEDEMITIMFHLLHHEYITIRRGLQGVLMAIPTDLGMSRLAALVN